MDYYILITDVKYEDRGLLAEFPASNCPHFIALQKREQNYIYRVSTACQISSQALWYIMLLNIK